MHHIISIRELVYAKERRLHPDNLQVMKKNFNA